MKTIPLSSPVKSVLRTTAEYVKLLGEVGISTVEDLLTYYPREYEDRTAIREISELRADEKNVLKGSFSMVRRERTRTRMTLVKAVLTTDSGYPIECVWFNQPYIHTMIPVEKPVVVVGKAKLSYGKISLQNPTFEEAGEEAIHAQRIVPVYREHGKVSTMWFRKKIFSLLDPAEEFPQILPDDIVEEESLIRKHEAVMEIHFPTDREKLEKAKKTLAFEELYLLQLASLHRKQKWRESAGGEKIVRFDPDLQKRFFHSLPFTPTNSQKIAIFEILKDMEKPVPMLRLLEGDVGSGKTLVAVSAAIAAIESGYQVAFMAPTEILSQQHFEKISELLGKFPLRRKDGEEFIRIERLTGAIKGKKREEILENLRLGKIDLLIGTHALIEEWVIFHSLGLVIIDEQHRFGVRQRESLVKFGSPHLLQMTATPIPRTLAIVAFGDQDLSVLTEMPPGRKPVHTKVVPPASRKQVELFIESEVKKGRQAFVICPLVSESEKIEAKAAEEEFVRLKNDVFPHLRLALIHGRMKPKEKEEIMEAFKTKKSDILVATSVIEVGIDIPNATIILIEGAERFGLSQLHQFRGRVGRSGIQSYAFLFPTEQPNERLRALEKIMNGFELAEIDLKLRGPGEVYGLRQSGIPDLKMAGFSDGRLVVKARQAAEKTMEKGETGMNEVIMREVRLLNDRIVGRG